MAELLQFRAPGAPTPAFADQQAEMQLLGTLLINPRLLQELPAGFSPDHYAFGHHCDIHRAIVELGQPGVPATVAVMNALASNDRELRGYIAELIGAMVGMLPPFVVQAAGIVTELYRRRCIIEAADAMRADVYADAGLGASDVAIARAMTALEGISTTAAIAAPARSLNDAIDMALARADEAATRQGPSGVSTGMASVDERLGGLDAGTLTVLGGRPGMGKSALGMQWALAAAKAGHGVLAISLEMSATELGRRVLAVASGVPVGVMKRGQHAAFAGRLVAARRDLRDLPMTIEDGGGLTAGMIRLKARAAHRKHGLGLILVDHLHIVRPDDVDVKSSGATWAVGRVSGEMKRMAKEFSCPVLLLAQLNRGVEGRDDKRPGLSDLRQSGDIEQDADAVAFVYRAEYYLGKEPEKATGESAEKHANKVSEWLQQKDAAKGKADLIVSKVRDGSPGTVPLRFHGETTSFSEHASDEPV